MDGHASSGGGALQEAPPHDSVGQQKSALDGQVLLEKATDAEWYSIWCASRYAIEEQLHKQDLLVGELLRQLGERNGQNNRSVQFSDTEEQSAVKCNVQIDNGIPLAEASESLPPGGSLDDGQSASKVPPLQTKVEPVDVKRSIDTNESHMLSHMVRIESDASPGNSELKGATSSKTLGMTSPTSKQNSDFFSEADWKGSLATGRHAHTQKSSKKLKKENTRNLEAILGSALPSGSIGNTILMKVIHAWNWIENLEEPKRHGRMAHMAESKWFETLTGTVILLNCLFTIGATNATITRTSLADTQDDPGMMVIELLFCIFFLFEMLVKVRVHKLYFFVNEDMGWNILDLSLVTVSSANLLVTFLRSADGGVNVSFLRSFRMLKITRVLRMLRVIKFCRDLRMMLDVVLSSVRALIWVIALLFVLFGVFALLFVQLVTEYVSPERMCGSELCPGQEIMYYFGSVELGMLTLYMSTTGGLNWHEVFDVLKVTGPLNAGAFVFFTLVFYFCIYNLLTGMFVDQAVKAAQPCRDHIILEQRAKETQQVEELKRLCLEFDENSDNLITFDEFSNMVENERVCLWLAAFGLDIADAKVFFQMLLAATEDDYIPVEIFVQGCMRLRGEATSIDMQALSFQVRNISRKQIELLEEVKSRFAELPASPAMVGHQVSASAWPSIPPSLLAAAPAAATPAACLPAEAMPDGKGDRSQRLWL